MTVVVREAVPAEYEAIGALTVAAYAIFAEADDDGTYMAELRDVAGRARACPIYVAVDGDPDALRHDVVRGHAQCREPRNGVSRNRDVVPADNGQPAGNGAAQAVRGVKDADGSEVR